MPKRRAEEDRVASGAEALLTCGAVHHRGCHAVGLGLGAHQAGAVVHGLAVGRAGGHQATLVHARKTALPAGRGNRHNTLNTTVPAR